jgi:two-component sensor histidine kinase
MLRIEKNIENFTLDAKRLQNLVIIINELLTNIMKYAFVGRVRGAIAVSIALVDNRVCLTIEDDGIGIPDSVNFENSSGFGLTLVGELAKQLHGSIRIERGEGTRFILTFERS